MEKKYRPIGVFDSGLGGLTVVKDLLAYLPQEDIVFFGDTARVPYDGRSRETITAYVREDIDFLMRHDVKAVVIACNTADSMAREAVEKDYSVPMVGVVLPAAKKAAAVTVNRLVGVIGTKATVESRAYETAMAEIAPAVRVFPVACPLLAPLVEEGRFHKGDEVVDRVLSDYLQPLKAKGVDTLILGCTHYPLLYESIAAIMPDTRLICSGPASTEALIALLDAEGLRNDSGKPGSIRYYVSDAPAKFAENGGKFIGREIHGSVTLVSSKAPSLL